MSTRRNVQSGSQNVGGQLDLQVIDFVAPHLQAAVEMDRICEQRAEHRELKSFCQEAIRYHQQHLSQLLDLRDRFFNSRNIPSLDRIPVLPGLSMQGGQGMGSTTQSTMSGSSSQGMAGVQSQQTVAGTQQLTVVNLQREVDQLRSLSGPVDQPFINMVIPHIEMTIQACQLVQQQGSHQEIKDVCRQILDREQQEVNKLRQYQQQWYK